MRKNKITKLKDETEESDSNEIVLINGKMIDDTALIFYEGQIQTTLMHSLVNLLKELEERQNDGKQIKKFSLVINSAGGDTSFITSFYSFAKHLGLQSIYGIGQVSSAALSIMLDCKKNKLPVYIDPLCHVIVHRVKTVWIGEERYERITKYNERWVKRYEDIFDNINKEMLSKLSSDMIKEYEMGYDVYLLGMDLIEHGIFDEVPNNIFQRNK